LYRKRPFSLSAFFSYRFDLQCYITLPTKCHMILYCFLVSALMNSTDDTDRKNPSALFLLFSPSSHFLSGHPYPVLLCKLHVSPLFSHRLDSSAVTLSIAINQASRPVSSSAPPSLVSAFQETSAPSPPPFRSPGHRRSTTCDW
jgi:hypothetical protein